jgi:GT2 family glycosyltransferase
MTFEPDVTIIIPIYKPNEEIMARVDKALAEQKYKGRIIIKKINKGGFGKTFNNGVINSTTDIVVSLHQDCMPVNDTWLRDLVAPLEDNDTVASVSKVDLPYEFWNTFDPVGKVLSAKEQQTVTPALDQKGCANKKVALLKVGLFNTDKFATAGEDYDMYLRLKNIGKIAYPETKVIHYHIHSYKNRFAKELQLSNSFGALVRMHGSKIDHWYIGFLKAIPIIGWPIFLLQCKPLKIKHLILLAIPLSLVVNFIYAKGFWKGFFGGRQTQTL